MEPTTRMENTGIVERLFALQDVGYRSFQANLIPTIAPRLIIGVRIPDLRALAKAINKTPDADMFMASTPHAYFEENNLHAFLIERMRDFDEAAHATDAFLPFVNNWATCDSLSPKVFARHPDRLLGRIDEWTESDAAFTVRFGIGMLMRHFLDERFEERFLDTVARIAPDGWQEAPGTLPAQCADAENNKADVRGAQAEGVGAEGPAASASGAVRPKLEGEGVGADVPKANAECGGSASQRRVEKHRAEAKTSAPGASYYVNMMRAWYFATALAKQPRAALPFIENGRLDPWTHNKAIQEAIESRRIDADLKAHLRTLRIR